MPDAAPTPESEFLNALREERKRVGMCRRWQPELSHLWKASRRYMRPGFRAQIYQLVGRC